MGSHGSRYISKQVKAETAAIGFRVKSGWAAVVLLTGPVHSPQVHDVVRIDLSDPRLAETRQPYHAATGKLEADTPTVNQRVRVVRRVTQGSIRSLLASYHRRGYRIRRASLVVGSQIDPDSIPNPHIRAHAFEGQLFRSVVEDALHAHDIRAAIFPEHDAFTTAAAELKKSSDDVRGTIQRFGGFIDGPWRAEQKLAALGAWLALCHKPALSKRKKDENL
jgi:hypothetical protein